LDSELLVVNIPPGRRNPDVEKHHSAQMRYLYEVVRKSGIKRVIFVSSTSVYAPLGRLVTEAYTALNTPDTASGRVLRKVEQLWLQNDNPFTTTILRMAGLVGGNRHPVKYLAGKTNLPNADAPVNLVHLHDCLAAVTLVLNNPPRSTVYNICADEHPTRQQFYTFAARKLGLEPPQFLSTKSAGFNIIDNSLFKSDYHYHYRYPSPMLFY
ncbi:MAG TPA: SDR family NAD(P)-dependent oxidoreductase, partial [Chitinophagales bacterium]|nr:SDR family NAD(P)-dependent oxidoreductase [Chitinophagales bacterium]